MDSGVYPQERTHAPSPDSPEKAHLITGAGRESAQKSTRRMLLKKLTFRIPRRHRAAFDRLNYQPSSGSECQLAPEKTHLKAKKGAELPPEKPHAAVKRCSRYKWLSGTVSTSCKTSP